MTRMLVWAALLAAAHTAHADRRARPDKFAAAAGDAFNKAIEAEDRGDLRTAIAFYQKSFAITPHPNTAFNLAEAYARKQDYGKALIEYEVYLALAPNANDRAAVRATITEIETRPTIYEITNDDGPEAIDLEAAYVLVDGAIVKKPGPAAVSVKLVQGFHTIDVVTTISFTSKEVEVRRGGGTQTFHANAPPRVDGTAVLSMATLDLVYAQQNMSEPTRVALPVGRQTIGVYDGQHECKPITLDVKGGSTIAYVHVALAEPDNSARGLMPRPERCRKLRVAQLALVFK